MESLTGKKTKKIPKSNVFFDMFATANRKN